MDKNFNAKEAEAKWLTYWEENKTFHSEVNEKPSYTIVIPPPNVTGVLHMGHVLNNSLQDFFIRKAIGWALREYRKTDPEWVADFLEKYGSEMSGLSRREALR